jgi:hypothetical protein
MIARVLFLIFFCSLIILSRVQAQTSPSGQGLWIVTSCSTITNPINGQTWCFLANSNPPAVYEYLSNSFVAILPAPTLTTGQALINFQNGTPNWSSLPYTITFPINGVAAAYQNTVYITQFAYPIHFPVNFTSTTYPANTSTGSCGTAPSEPDVWTLKDLTQATTLGTITLGTGCNTSGTNAGVTLSTTGGIVQNTLANDVLEIQAPSIASGANQVLTFNGFSP